MKAKSALSVADSYRKAGNVERAREKYQSVIDQFPGTSYAETARRQLAEMGKQ